MQYHNICLVVIIQKVSVKTYAEWAAKYVYSHYNYVETIIYLVFFAVQMINNGIGTGDIWTLFG